MKPQSRAAIFAVAVVATNWHWQRKVERTTESRPGGAVLTSSTTTTIDGAGLWTMVCVVVLVTIGRRLYKDIRLLLDQSVRIPRQVKMIDLWPIAFLTPLLYSMSYGMKVTDDNVVTTITSGYGSTNWSIVLFVLASFVIVVYQARLGIRRFVPTSKA